MEVGFICYEITVNDIINGSIDLKDFRGLAFVGGFSFSDVLGSGVGWYSSIIHNPKVRKQFDDFYNRNDTFSLGVCNGCQLLSLLGWLGEEITLEKIYQIDLNQDIILLKFYLTIILYS